MKIKFLGTGGVLGVPVWNCHCHTCKSTDKKNKRYRSSCLIEIEEKNIVIDFGQDFRTQLLENKIEKMDYALLTHAHGDHKNGSENLSTANNLSLQAPKGVLEQVEKETLNWLKKRNESILIKEFEPFKIGEVEIETVALQHDKDYTDKKTPCYGYLFKSPNFKFAYMSDYNKILEKQKIKNLDLIISDGCNMENIGNGHVRCKRKYCYLSRI